MKFRISLVLLTLALAASSAATAYASNCTTLTIRGTYAFPIHGQILTPTGPLLVDGIARTTFDGNGNLTQVDAVAVNGIIALVWRPATGTYTLNPDCTGTMTLVNQRQPPLDLAILLTHPPRPLHTIVPNPPSPPPAAP